METLQSVPLFPLNTILFPTMPLPLHIFEERYKQMIDRCLDAAGILGIIALVDKPDVGEMIQPGDLPRVGTLARIVSYESLPDGRYGINTRGTDRFTIDTITQQSPYLIATVRVFPSDPDANLRLQEPAQRLHALFDRFYRLAQERGMTGPRSIPIPTEADKLAWLIAASLPTELREKQQLLDLDTLDTVIDAEIQILQANLRHLENNP